MSKNKTRELALNFTSNTVWPFSKKTSITDLFAGTTDHHSHILPGVDDGVESIDEAQNILATYERLGMKELWLTPHIMEDIPNTPEKLRTRFLELKAAYKGNIQLHLAAEYMIDNHLRKLLQETTKLRPALEGRWHEQSKVTEGDKTTEPQGEISLNSPSFQKREYPKGEGDRNPKQDFPHLLPIGKKRDHLLVETSYFNPPMRFKETLKQIKSNGFHPLLAHPERYMYMDNDEYRELHDEGIRFQLNILSLAGSYGKAVKKRAEWLLAHDLYSVAGSDLHSQVAIDIITNCKLGQKESKKLELLLKNSI